MTMFKRLHQLSQFDSSTSRLKIPLPEFDESKLEPSLSVTSLQTYLLSKLLRHNPTKHRNL